MSGTAERFKNRKEALIWLKDSGYKISQGKFYQDCAAGYPVVHKDGTVSKFQVLEYGQRLDSVKKENEAAMIAAREYSERKEKADAEIAEMKAEKMRREENKHWLYAGDAWAQVAALIGTLKDAIRHELFAGQRELVEMAGGDQDRSQEIFEHADQLVARAFNKVAGDSITITFEKEQER